MPLNMASATGRARLFALAAGLLLLLPALLAACGGGDTGLSRAEVEDIVQSEMAAATSQVTSQDSGPSPGMVPADVEGIVNDAIDKMPPPEPGLTRAEVEAMVREEMAGAAAAETHLPEAGPSHSEVEEIVRAAMGDIPEPQPGLTAEEAEEIARAAVAAIPSKTAPADYTQFFVDNAIARYQRQGLDATLAHYNNPRSVDGQWYVFIMDENGLVVGHPDRERRGLDLKGWVGTDLNGYQFGPEMLSATEEGKWVSYVYRNPESGGIGTGDFQLKNVWVERRDGLLFASGWYIDADSFTEQLVSVAVDKYRNIGLAGTIAYFASPGSALAGLDAAIEYYNVAETVDGHWFAFIGDPKGNIVGHSDISLIGGDVQDLFGQETVEATENGAWVESESLRVFVAGYDGHVFGSGWSRDE